MDCATWTREQCRERLAAVLPNGSTTFKLSVFFGSLHDRFGGQPVPVTCKRMGIATLDSEAASLQEYLESGQLSDHHEPPVLVARLRDMAWHGEAARWPFEKRDWVSQGWKCWWTTEASFLSFFGEGMSDFTSPEFSDFRV